MWPFQPDQRGTLRTVSDPVEMAEQFLTDLIETFLQERVMLPCYGMRDRVFGVLNVGFTAQLAADLDEQARFYLPIIKSIEVLAGELKDEIFIPGFAKDEQRAAIKVKFTVRGSNIPQNLVYPTWKLRS
ncbi:MAG: hypothetical protein AUG51_07380 [Acidobacteria bacterium 13_1_20CM_3_53_8]|nr:MAG: hypothetical protein AUG51_07380 [Acidobacteria bacterium 13_1_20CM_3_53_8]